MEETDRLTVKDAAPFALVIIVTLAVIGFIITASSAHANETIPAETQGNGASIVQDTYVNEGEKLFPAVLASDANISFDEAEEVAKWDPAKVNNAVEYKVSVTNHYGNNAYFRTVIGLEASAAGKELAFLNANTEDFTWSKVDDLIDVDGTKYVAYVAVYDVPLQAGHSVDVVTHLAMKPSAGSSDVAKLGEDFSIVAMTQAVVEEPLDQGAIGVGSIESAFGKVTAESHPWSS